MPWQRGLIVASASIAALQLSCTASACVGRLHAEPRISRPVKSQQKAVEQLQKEVGNAEPIQSPPNTQLKPAWLYYSVLFGRAVLLCGRPFNKIVQFYTNTPFTFCARHRHHHHHIISPDRFSLTIILDSPQRSGFLTAADSPARLSNCAAFCHPLPPPDR
ncbi:hypothetical protein ABW21_db0201991 [Orbilia brochopaga]|nr:hypothetical protein ABW21_db0201991 [Drechslerella brochopaga]